MIKKILACFCLFFCIIATKTHAMFCPTNFNQINIGDNIEQVVQLCGKPDVEKESTLKDFLPQEWIYYVALGKNAEASVKMNVAFENKKVVNITVNAMSLAATTLCGNNIKTGDDTEAVKAACGNPTVVNEHDPRGKDDAPKDTKQIIYQYNTTPPVTLIFEKGKLTERK